MTVVTPRAVFIHIGRTGGHWVSHVLWKAGLVEARLEPIHMRPAEIRLRPEAQDKAFWFTFVRHPLHWLRSLWVHGIEHSWGDPALAAYGLTEDFPTFLERIGAAYPKGPFSTMMAEHINGAHFVGRTERLAEDLIVAMQFAGETFEPAIARTTPMLNSSATQRILSAAKAPRALLEKLLAQDAEFTQRFDYHGIPESLIEENPPRVALLPRLPIKRQADVDLAEVLRGARFDQPVRFEGEAADVVVDDQNVSRRPFWALLAGLESVPVAERGRLLHVDAGDSYLAHLAKSLGYREVTAFVPVRRRSCEALAQLTGNSITFEERELFSPEPRRRYDVVLLSELLRATAAPMLTIAACAQLLEHGGTLIARAVILDASLEQSFMVPVRSGLLPPSETTMMVCTRAGLVDLLHNAGFTEIEFVDQFHTHKVWQTLEPLARSFGADVAQLFLQVLVKARFCPERLAGPGYTLNTLEDMWWRQRPLYMSDPANLAPDAPLRRQADLLQEQIAQQQAEAIRLTGELADRNDDLVGSRAELVQTRALLAERTELLERAVSDLAERTRELVQTRGLLAERTELLERAALDLVERTRELVQTRALLIERGETPG
jgi:hypothetical protein